MVVKEGTEVFLHSSDVSGPVEEEALSFIYTHCPGVIYIDGPGTYLGPRFGLEALKQAAQTLVRLETDLKPETLVLDQKLLSDLSWRAFAAPVFEAAAQNGTTVTTAAGFMGQNDLLLEAERLNRYKKSRKSLTLCK